MKIRNEQLAPLQGQEARRKSQVEGEEDFASLLAEKLGSAQGIASAAPGAAGLTSLQGMPGIDLDGLAQNPEIAALLTERNEVAQGVDNLLAGFESYTAELGRGSGADLRGAYASLQGMTGTIAGLRSAHPDMAAKHPQLADMVNELDALAVTETFKFNRGDYL